MKLPELLEITRLFFDRHIEGGFDPVLFMQGLSSEALKKFAKIKNPQAWIISVLNEFVVKQRDGGEYIKEDENTEQRTYFDSVCEIITALCKIGVDYKDIDYYTAHNILYHNSKNEAIRALYGLRVNLDRRKRREFDIFIKGIESKKLSYINRVIENHRKSIEAYNG